MKKLFSQKIIAILPVCLALVMPSSQVMAGTVSATNNSVDDTSADVNLVGSNSEVKIGDTIELGTYYGEPISWKCMAIDENGPLMYSEKILCLKAFDVSGLNAQYHSDNWGYRGNYGSNCWSDSTLRQWLNSDDEVVSYTHCPPTNNSINHGDAYDQEPGFLTNFSESEKKCIKTVTNKMNIIDYDAQRPGYCNGGSSELPCYYQESDIISRDFDSYYYQNVQDQIFLPNAKQLYEIKSNFSDWIKACPTQQAIDHFSHKDPDVLAVDKNWCFWTGVPLTEGAAYELERVYGYFASGADGYFLDGKQVANKGFYGVRPAFYLDVDAYQKEDNNNFSSVLDAMEYNGHYYRIYPMKGAQDSWEAAEQYCESLGGHLATITSQEEQDKVFSYVNNNVQWYPGSSSAYAAFDVFFGLYRDSSGNWVWVTGEPYEYSFWADGEPSGTNWDTGVNEYYGQYYYKWSNSGRWNDQCSRAGDNIYFLCEWDSKKPDMTGGELDYTTYQADYTQIVNDFMMDKNTFTATKIMVRNENWPAFDYVYTNDQTISTYITAAITNILFRYEKFEGGRDLVTGEISKEYAREVLLALMDQKDTEIQALVKAREAQNMAKKISDGFDNFINKSKWIAIPAEDREHLEKFFHSETIDKKLKEGKYSDLVNMCHLNGYENSSTVVKILKLYQKSSEFSKMLSDTLKISGKTLDAAEELNDLVQLIYNFKVTTETNQLYIELMTYIRDNVKFSVVRDAAAEIVDVLNTNTDDQWKKITAAVTLENGKEFAISKLSSALSDAANKTFGVIITTSFKTGVNLSNQIFGTANYQKKYDNMRVLAYLGDAIGQWTLGNYSTYLTTDDSTTKNSSARKTYYGLKLLLKTRQDGEESLQGLWIGSGEKNFKKSWYYQTSSSRSALLKTYEETLFTSDREKIFNATAVACPVDVEVYDASGTTVLTIKNGQEIPITISGDITYTEYLNPGSGEYDKVVLLPQNSGYSLKCVGNGLGIMNLHTMNMSSNDEITDKNLQNIPITPTTTAEITDFSANNGIVTLTTGNESQKSAMQLKNQDNAYVSVASLTLNPDKLQLKEGETALVTVNAQPENATDQSVTWTSEADKIATVSSDGVVTGISAGQVTLTASAEDGEVIRKLKVTVVKNSDSQSSGGSNSVPAVQPTPTVQPEPTDTPDVADKNKFTDVDSNVWYHDAVCWAVEKNITSGTSQTTFSPNDPCTRGQIVAFLYRIAGSPGTDKSLIAIFNDVPADKYYCDAVAWAIEKGITVGTSATTFSPEEPCTRAEAVTFLYRYENSPSVTEGKIFSDVRTDDYYADAVSWASEKKITVGTTDVTFSPDKECKRAEIITFLYRDMTK